jgi:hypothetical protein
MTLSKRLSRHFDRTIRAIGSCQDLLEGRIGDSGENRTGVRGVAVHCMTTLPPA